MAITTTHAESRTAKGVPALDDGSAHDDLGELMSVDQLASYMGIPKNTLYYWRNQGTGPRAMKVGKYVRYRRADIQAWLDASLETGR